ncbi:MAG: methyltransferase domain-containing protein [Rhodothermales bacterium]|nr:methyltransferase domain-containing protein [Rhodothermales bacterium]
MSSTHWDRIFADTETERLGWFENDLSPTLERLAVLGSLEGKTVFLPGVGTSGLASSLLDQGATLVLNDISPEALRLLQAKVPADAPVTWLSQDISEPLPPALGGVDVWIDRAVLHFLTAESQIQRYFDNLRRVLKRGGHALFAEFARDGAIKCAGLDVHQYDASELAERLGPGFRVLERWNHVYHTPAGDARPYVYALFRRE